MAVALISCASFPFSFVFPLLLLLTPLSKGSSLTRRKVQITKCHYDECNFSLVVVLKNKERCHRNTAAFLVGWIAVYLVWKFVTESSQQPLALWLARYHVVPILLRLSALVLHLCAAFTSSISRFLVGSMNHIMFEWRNPTSFCLCQITLIIGDQAAANF